MSTKIYHFQYKQENHPKLSQICSCGIFSKGLKNEFETTAVNEPSVFEPLTFYCVCLCPSVYRSCVGHASEIGP